MTKLMSDISTTLPVDTPFRLTGVEDDAGWLEPEGVEPDGVTPWGDWSDWGALSGTATGGAIGALTVAWLETKLQSKIGLHDLPQTLPAQVLDWQSEFLMHALLLGHGLQVAPPQSMSVSSRFMKPSEQDGIAVYTLDMVQQCKLNISYSSYEEDCNNHWRNQSWLYTSVSLYISDKCCHHSQRQSRLDLRSHQNSFEWLQSVSYWISVLM